MERNCYYIYALMDPFTMDYKYVGSTSDIKKRFYQHCNHFDIGREKSAWIKDLIGSGHKPVLVILEFANGQKQRKDFEAHWIKELGLTHLLFNRTDSDFKYPWEDMLVESFSSFKIKDCNNEKANSAQQCGTQFYKRRGLVAKVSYRIVGTDCIVYVDIKDKQKPTYDSEKLKTPRVYKARVQPWKREIIELYFNGGLQIQEIADVVKKTHGTVSSVITKEFKNRREKAA